MNLSDDNSEDDSDDPNFSDEDDEKDEDGDTSTMMALSTNNESGKESKEFPCKVCGRVFKWTNALRRHELMHLCEF